MSDKKLYVKLKNCLKFNLIFFIMLTSVMPLGYYSSNESINDYNSNNLINRNQESKLKIQGDIPYSQTSEYDEKIYIEQIAIEISDEISTDLKPSAIVHNSLLTNNINLLEGLEFNNPALFGCSFFFTQQTSEYPFSKPIDFSQDFPQIDGIDLIGLLYFNQTETVFPLSYSRDFLISKIAIATSLQIQLMDPIYGVNATLYPFFAWNSEIDESYMFMADNILNNIPTDGLFNNLINNIYPERKNSESDLFLGENLIFLHKVEAIDEIQSILRENYWNSADGNGYYYDFQQLLESNPIYNGFSILNQSISQLKQNISISEPQGLVKLADVDWNEYYYSEEYSEFEKLKGFFLYDFLYEAIESGFEIREDNTYDIDFKKLIGMASEDIIQCSKNAYYSLLGWLSGLNLIIYNSEVIEIYPQKLNFSRIFTAPFENFMFLDDKNNYFDDLFINYHIGIEFYIEGSKTFLTSIIEKKNDVEAEIEDIFQYVIPKGLPTLPVQILEKIDNIQFTIQFQDSIPNLKISKVLQGGSNIYQDLTSESNINIDQLIENANEINIIESDLSNNFGLIPESNQSSDTSIINFDLILQNNGNTTIWGVPIKIHECLGFQNYPANTLLTRTILDMGYNIDSMFSQEIPRFFPIDPFGQGFYTGYSPDIFSLEDLTPYSPTFSQVILDNIDYLIVNTPYTENDLIGKANDYNNTNSLYNSANWCILPNETITLNFSQKLLNHTYITEKITDIYANNVFSYEYLFSASVKYSTVNGLNIYTSKSNEIAVIKKHDFYDAFQNHIANLTDFNGLNNFSENISVIQILAGIMEVPKINWYNSESIPNFNMGYSTINLTIINKILLGLDVDLSTGVIDNIDLVLKTLEPNSILNKNWTTEIKSGLPFEKINLLNYDMNSSYSNITFNENLVNTINRPGFLMNWNFTKNVYYSSNNKLNYSVRTVKSNDIFIGVSSNMNNLKNSNMVRISNNFSVASEDFDYQTSENMNIFYNFDTLNDFQFNQFHYRGNLDKNLVYGINQTNCQILSNDSIKLEYKWYDYAPLILPPIFINLTHKIGFRIIYTSMELIGIKDITVSKNISKDVQFLGDDFIITIKIHNTGNIPLCDILVDDTSTFSLVKQNYLMSAYGTVYIKIPLLLPDEEYIIQYSVISNNIGKFTLESIKLSYLYGNFQEIYSNQVDVLILPQWYVFVGGITGIIFIIFLFYIWKQKRAKFKQNLGDDVDY